MERHDQYHEITADTPRDMGLAMGRAFGKALTPFLKKLPELPDVTQAYLLDCIVFTRETFPDYTAEVAGYAEGAGVPEETMWHMLLEDDIKALPAEKCTSFATNKGRLVGHNEDWSADAASRLFLLNRNLAGNRLFELHYAGTLGGNAASINGHSLAQTVNSQDSWPVESDAPRAPSNIIARALADSKNPQETLKTLEKIPRMGGYAFTLANKEQTLLAELSQDKLAVREITSYPHIHANHYVLDEMLDFNRHKEDGPTSTRKRYAAAKAGAKETMTAQDAMTLLEDETGGPACALKNERTIAGVVFDLDAGIAHVRLAAENDKGWIPYNLTP